MDVREPVQYGLQILVNPGRPSAYWRFDDNYDLHDNADAACDDLADAVDTGYDETHLRVVAISVIPPDPCRICGGTGRDPLDPDDPCSGCVIPTG